MAVERDKDTGQMGEWRVVELSVREYRNVQDAGNELPGV